MAEVDAHPFDYKSALIIDPDPRVLARISMDSAFERLAPELCTGTGIPGATLKDATARYRGIYISANLMEPNWLQWIKAARVEMPATPVYLLYDPQDELPITPTLCDRLGIHGMVSLREPLVNWVAAVDHVEIPSHALEVKSVEDSAFVPVRVEEFFSGVPQLFDVHIRVPSGKFLPIARPGDILPIERLQSYVQHGVAWLYLSRSAIQSCLYSGDLLENSFFESPDISRALKMGKILGMGQRATQGPNLEYAQDFLGRLFWFIHAHEEMLNRLLDWMINRPAQFDHSVRVSVLCAVLARTLKLSRRQVMGQLGVAALFHDIGMVAGDDLLHFSSRIQMTPEEVSRFDLHFEQGVQTLLQMGCEDEAVIQALRQHHERRDGRGYPGQSGAGQIHLYAEIIGIVEEFLRLSEQRIDLDAPAIMSLMRVDVFSGFSLKINEAFLATFGA